MSARSAKPNPPPAGPPLPLFHRWYAAAVLLLASILLLTLSYAPFGQFYLGWVGLVPWLIFVAKARSTKQAFWWSWLGGVVFYVANMWWLAFVTLPGTVALLGYIGIYWGIAAIVFRRAALLPTTANPEPRAPSPLLAIIAMAGIWVALEWIRGHLFWGGLPWLYLGHSQTPVLAMCQIADITGAYGVSFWVMLLNALVALSILRGWRAPELVAPKLAVGVVLLVVLGYGTWRLGQDTLYAGPKVLLVQPNVPQSNDPGHRGQKGATEEEFLQFHLKTTNQALAATSDVSLVVWSETVMPQLNPRYALFMDALDSITARERALLSRKALFEIGSLARQHDLALLTGGAFADPVKTPDNTWRLLDVRNSAYFFNRNGKLSELRYDKIHLVPFGEFIPFKDSFPPLYHLISLFNPYEGDYSLHAGADDAMTVFAVSSQDARQTWRFVTPICFEDIVPELTAAMFRPEPGQSAKRADFLVNLTNDGWFRFNQNALHLQTAAFRSIENRVPTARAVNTGISAIIDSRGRVLKALPARTDGWLAGTLPLDRRVTFYTRFGDVFALVCVTALTAVILWPLGRLMKRWILKPRAADKT